MIEVYCGDGKGKTTAAIGLAVRAAGRGKRVLFMQFMKGSDTGEIKILSEAENITVMRCDKIYGFFKSMTDNDKADITASHNENLNYVVWNMENFDVIILDEIFSAYEHNLANRETIIDIMNNYGGELVLTGRNPADVFLNRADYISEIMNRRHPFDNGVKAREGIEF